MQDTFHAVPTKQGKQPPLIVAGLNPAGNKCRQFGFFPQEKIKTFFLNSGKLSNRSSRIGSTANNGIKPTIDLTFSFFWIFPFDVKDIIEEIILVVPKRNMLRGNVVHRTGDIQEMLQEFGGTNWYTLLNSQRSNEIRRRFSENIAIHEVPSACSSFPW